MYNDFVVLGFFGTFYCLVPFLAVFVGWHYFAKFVSAGTRGSAVGD